MAGSVQDDIRKFQLEINSANKNGETQADLIKIQKETSKLRAENEQLEKVLAHIALTQGKSSDAYKKLETQLKANKATIRQNADVMKGLQKNIDLNYMSMGQLKKRANELRSALSATVKAADPDEYARLEKELGQVGAQMDKLKGKSNNTKSALAGIKEGAKSMLPAFGWAALITGAISFGKKIFDLREQTFEYRKQISQLTDLSGPALIDLTARLMGTAETFNVELKDLAIANHNFAESMNISEKQANKLINDGFLAGADASGEFIDRLREYGPQFKAAGLSAEQAIALMTTEVKSGVFSDKGTDAIKEATLALREMPQTTRDALDAIGISSSDMMDQLSSGQITVFDAIQKVSKKMGTLPPQSSEVGQAMADIFKGAGEDAGLDYILMLGDVETSLDSLKANAGEMALANEKLLESNTNLALAWNITVGESNASMTKAKAVAKDFAAGALVALQAYFFGAESVIKNFSNNVETTNTDTNKKIATENAALSKKIIAAQKELESLKEIIGKNAFEKRIAQENSRWQKEKLILENRLINKEKLSDKELAYNDIINSTILLKTQDHNQKLNEILAEQSDKRKVDTEKLQKDLLSLRKQYGLVKSAELLYEELKEFKGNELSKLLTAEQYAKAIANIHEKYATPIVAIEAEEFDTSALDAENDAIIAAEAEFEQKRADIRRQYGLMSLDEMENIELVRLQTLHDQKLLSETEYLQAKADLEKSFDEIRQEKDDVIRQKKIEDTQNTLSSIAAISQLFSDIFATMQDSELKVVQDKVDKGIISEEKGKKEELAIKKKYADKQFVAAAATIIASTAVGAMNAYSSMASIPYVGPALGIIAAAAVATAGAIQLDSANKERQRVKSLSVGGYTGSGSKNQEADLVQLHKNEYVIPAEGVDNPAIRPFINILENQRVAGTLGTMNMPNINSARVGGYQNVSSGNNGADFQTPNYTGMSNIVNEFGQHVNKLQKGIPAYMNDRESRKLTEQQTLDAKLLAQTAY